MVVGVPGVGKTTVVEMVKARMKGTKLMTFGTVMFEEAVRLKWVKDRDQLRTLPVGKQERLQTLAATRIAKMKEDAVLVDTHLFIRTKEGYWPGLPFEVVRALNPTHLVLVEASPQEIAARRAADKSRSRDSLTEEGLSAELALGRSFLVVSSTLTGAPMLIVTNHDGRSDEAVASITEMLREASA